MIKKSTLLLSLLLSLSIVKMAYARTSGFENYTPTLSSSGYNIVFQQVPNPSSESDYKFTTYVKNNNGNFDKVYYTYTFTHEPSTGNRTTSDTPTDIYSHFIGNQIDSFPLGGAIYGGNHQNITGDFVVNSITFPDGSSNGFAYGGAIALYASGSIKDIKGDFIGNFTIHPTGILPSSYGALGGAIVNTNRTIGNITGNFIGNYTSSTIAGGGALANTTSTSLIGDIKGDFIHNYALSSLPHNAFGGAIHNTGTISNIEGDFVGNYAVDAYAGAILNSGTIGVSTEGINGSFISNHATSTSATDHLALGGAIYTSTDLTLTASGSDNLFIGNYTEDKRGIIHNAIFVRTTSTSSPTLIFVVKNGGNFIFFDNISGADFQSGILDYTYQYNINVDGDGSGNMIFKNYVENAENFNVSNATVRFEKGFWGQGGFTGNTTNLSLVNSTFDINNGYVENITLNNYSADNAFIHLNINKQNNLWVSDKLEISGDIDGKTQIIVYALHNSPQKGSIVFAHAPNDTILKNDAFSIYRVYGSPYMWDALRNINGETSGSTWYLSMNNTTNPDYPVPPVPPVNKITPEVIAYSALHAASLEQTRSMVNNIRNKVAANKILIDTHYGYFGESHDVNIMRNLWANPVYYSFSSEAPFDIDADIWGLEAGFDVQYNASNKLGIFASYRTGDYNLSGKGEKMSSVIGSNIDITSYIAGIYYRYDRQKTWSFATLYAGTQKADIKTKDGLTSDTDGLELGASLEAGYLFNLSQTINLEPGIGIFYTQIDFDDINDTYGKSANYNTVSQTEFEAGLKLEKMIKADKGIAKFYIKPSVIQQLSNGDSVTITGLSKVDTLDDRTLGRIEIGSRYAITNQLSSYGFINYTFGSKYDATFLSLGLNYAW